MANIQGTASMDSEEMMELCAAFEDSTGVVVDQAMANELIRDICELEEAYNSSKQLVKVDYEALRTTIYRALLGGDANA